MVERLRNVFQSDERDPNELTQLFRLMKLFLELDQPPDSFGLYSNYRELKQKFADAMATEKADLIESSFLELYCHVHGYEAPYTKDERIKMDKLGGYWCHAGGVSPILKAEPWINPDTISADYGAGNGLQCLLLQRLYPHKKTVQIELSSKMVESGKELQSWLGIDRDRVEWIVGDVAAYSPKEIDFIYIYRPVRPVGTGIDFYKNFSIQLRQSQKKTILFSIADCLADYLEGFETFYSDGHLTCFMRS